jgi:glycosyltransferase domain-containing protein
MSLEESKIPFLKKLTIVILTYNRQAYVLRSMQYWSGKNVNIVVIDGTEKRVDLVIVSQFKSNIKYIHGPACYYKRMLSAIHLVETEYVLFGCDDEFYIPSAINSCITKLSLDHELVTCGCESIGFDWKNNLVIGFNVDTKLKNHNLNDLIPADRIKKHFFDYVPAHYYSVCRTDIWKIAVEETFSKKYSCQAITELQFEFLMAYSGKSLIIPELMCLRSSESENSSINKFFLRKHKFDKWWLSKEYKKEKDDFIMRMELSCKKINKKNRAEHKPEIENCFDEYLQFYKKNINIFYKLFFPFFEYLPVYLKNKIKNLFKGLRYISFKNKKLPLIACAKLMEKENVKIDFDELRKIEKNINYFYKKTEILSSDNN